MADNLIRFRALLDDKVSKPLDKIRGNFDKVGKSKGFKTFTQGVGMGAGISAFSAIGGAARAAADFIGDSIDASRDFTETLSKNKVVFGDASKGIEAFGDTTAKSLGISKAAAIEAAGSFGALFTGLDIAKKPAADMSTRLVTLAGDLASFYNIADPKDVFTRLQSGLSGEAEPLRRMGIFLTEAKVKAKAMELGLVDLNGEVSESAKVQARYALILEETTLAHGDAAKTIGELAGQQRVAAALLEEQQVRLGKAWEPQALEFTKLQVGVVEGLNAMDKAVYDAQSAIRLWATGVSDDTRKASAAFEASGGMAGDMAARIIGGAADVAAEVPKDLLIARDATLKLGLTANTTADRFGEMVDSVKKDALGLIEGYYDPITAADNLLANKAEANAARRILADKSATTAQKREARATLNRLAEDNDKIRLELLATGNLNKKAQADWFAELQRRLRNSTGKARAHIQGLIDKLRSLAATVNSSGFSVSVRGTGFQERRASGGPVSPHTAYTVGEEGPETLVMGSGSGTVLPYGAGAAGGSLADLHVHFHSLAAPTLMDQQRIAKVIGPELERWRRRQVS